MRLTKEEFVNEFVSRADGMYKNAVKKQLTAFKGAAKQFIGI